MRLRSGRAFVVIAAVLAVLELRLRLSRLPAT